MNAAERARVAIVGGGLAGAAAAYHLVRSGVRRVCVLEREPVCGAHASGRNAGMARQIVPDEALAALARDGASFLRAPPRDWKGPAPLRMAGSFLLAAQADWPALRAQAEAARARGVPAEARERARVGAPWVFPEACDGGVWCGTDGIVDVHALLEGLWCGVRHGGGTVRTGVEVRAVEIRRGAVAALDTTAGRIEADIVVNAAGAWAAELAARAGASPVPLRPCRRHLFVTEPAAWADAAGPFVWDVTHGFYVRPESGGFLLSGCDEDDHPPGVPVTDPAARLRLAEKLVRHAPRVAELAVRRSWAGLRTLTPDGRFVIGWDPALDGFFWIAGLGGHGVTACAAVGALAALMIAGGRRVSDSPFNPGRFRGGSGAGRHER